MKKFLVGILVFVLVFSVGFAQNQNQKKNFRFSFSAFPALMQNFSFSSFDYDDFNQNFNQVGRFSDNFNFDFLFRLLEKSNDWLTGCLNPEPFGAKASIMAKNLSLERGDYLPFYGMRKVNLTRSGFPWRVSVDLRISDSDFWMGFEVFQDRGYTLEVKEDFDFAVIDKLESEKIDVGGWLEGYNWYYMEISRKFKEQDKTVKYGNFNFAVMFKYDLAKEIESFNFIPELGANLCLIRERTEGLFRNYDYDVTMFPEFSWPDQPLDRYINTYRLLQEEQKIDETDYELDARFFVGLNMEYKLFRFLNLFSNARIYNKSFKKLFQEESLLGDFPFDLELNKFVFLAGLNLTF